MHQLRTKKRSTHVFWSGALGLCLSLISQKNALRHPHVTALSRQSAVTRWPIHLKEAIRCLITLIDGTVGVDTMTHKDVTCSSIWDLTEHNIPCVTKFKCNPTNIYLPLMWLLQIHLTYSTTKWLPIGQSEKPLLLVQMVGLRRTDPKHWSCHCSNHKRAPSCHLRCQSLEDSDRIWREHGISCQPPNLEWYKCVHRWVCQSHQSADIRRGAYHLRKQCRCTWLALQRWQCSQARLVSTRCRCSRTSQNSYGRFVVTSVEWDRKHSHYWIACCLLHCGKWPLTSWNGAVYLDGNEPIKDNFVSKITSEKMKKMKMKMKMRRWISALLFYRNREIKHDVYAKRQTSEWN